MVSDTINGFKYSPIFWYRWILVSETTLYLTWYKCNKNIYNATIIAYNYNAFLFSVIQTAATEK